MRVSKAWSVTFFPVVEHRPGVSDVVPSKWIVLADDGEEAIKIVKAAVSKMATEPFRLESMAPCLEHIGYGAPGSQLHVHLPDGLDENMTGKPGPDEIVNRDGTVVKLPPLTGPDGEPIERITLDQLDHIIP